VAVTANDRRAINPLAMGKFLKISDVPGVVEINKRHNYRCDITFKTVSTANEFLNHTCLINQNLKAFIPHNRLFRLRVLTNIDSEYRGNSGKYRSRTTSPLRKTTKQENYR
jgi:hypothetical protein